jgi:hypothetical protein
MAVPSSGTLSLIGLAREKVHDDYAGSGAISGLIPLKFVTLGGQGGSQQETYDVTNTGSVSNPDNVTPYGMSEFYGYDHDAVGLTAYTSSDSGANNKGGAACNLTGSNAYYHDGSGTYPAVNDTCYTSTAGTTTIPNYGSGAFGFWKVANYGAMRTANGVVTEIISC